MDAEGSVRNGKPQSDREEDEELPPTKKTKVESNIEQPATKETAKPPKCPDFLVGNLEDFYRSYPSFRQPSEIGFFSFNEKGDMAIDRSGIRYYSPPQKPSLGLDLKVGYSEFKPKLNQTPDLSHILTWVGNKWECFLPKFKNQKSIEDIPPALIKDTSVPAPPITKQSTANKLVKLIIIKKNSHSHETISASETCL